MGRTLKLFVLLMAASPLPAQVTTVINGNRSVPIANDITTGTTQYTFTKLTTAGQAIIAGTTDTSGILGVTVSGNGVTGNASVANYGIIPVHFDGTPTAGDYVGNSPTTAGYAHDFGTAPSGVTTQCLGRVESATAVSGTIYNIYWQPCPVSGGGGGGATPSGPAYAVQYANAAVNALQASNGFKFNPIDNALLLNAAYESVNEALYDPMNVAYDGGLAAAVAGTSGYTPTQVINAAADYGECQVQMGLAPAAPYRIKLPTEIGPISTAEVRLWGFTDFGGESFAARPQMLHADANSGMISGHSSYGVYSWATTTNTVTIQGPNNLIAGQKIVFTINTSYPGGPTAPVFLNGATYTVLSSGLTANQFSVTYTGATGSGTASTPGYPTFGSAQDQLTCSNGTTYTPGVANGVYVHDIAIGGYSPATPSDIGIWNFAGQGWQIARIGGVSNSFGAEGVYNNGFNSQLFQIGYVSAQISGCAAFTYLGSSYTTTHCGAVEDLGTDDDVDFVYASDGAQFNAGHAAGPCYPNCAAIWIGGANGHANNLFAQISDVGINLQESTSKNTIWRSDGTSREGVVLRASGGGTAVSDIGITSACTDTTNLSSNYAAGTATGCGAIRDDQSGNVISNVVYGTSAGVFGNSYTNCVIQDNNLGAAPQPNRYSLIQYQPNLNNTTQNDLKYCTLSSGFGADNASAAVTDEPSGYTIPLSGSTGATINVSGANTVAINSTTPVTTALWGVPGQILFIKEAVGTGGATIGSGGNLNPITAGEALSDSPRMFANVGPINSNRWYEIGGSSGGGLSGQTTNYLPLATSATASTTSSHVSDASGTVTSTEPIQVNSSGASVVSFTPNGTPAVVSGAASLASPPTLTTASTIDLPAAPCSGAFTTTNASGIMQIVCTPLQGSGANIETADILNSYQAPCVQTTDSRLGTTGCPYVLQAGQNLQALINTVSALGPSNSIQLYPGIITDTSGNGITLPDTGYCVNIKGDATYSSDITLANPTYAINGAYTATGTTMTLTFSGTVPAVGAQIVISGFSGGATSINGQPPFTITATSGSTATFNYTASTGSSTATGTATLVAPYVLGKVGTTTTPNSCVIKDVLLDAALQATTGLAIISETNTQVTNVSVNNVVRGANAGFTFGESSGSYPTTGLEVKNSKCPFTSANYNSTTAPSYCLIAQTSATDSHFTTIESSDAKALVRNLGGNNVYDGLNHIFGGGIAVNGIYTTNRVVLSGFEFDELTGTGVIFGTGSDGSSITQSFGVYGTPKSGATFASISSGVNNITINGNQWNAYTGNSITQPVIFPGTRAQNITITSNTPDFGETSLGGQYTITSSATPTWNLNNGLNQILTLSANTTLTLSNPVNIGLPGALLEICQPSGQSYTLTYPSTMKNGSAAPTSGGCITQNWVSEDGVNELATGPTVPLENVVTSATGGTGTSTVTCITTSPCTNLSGSYSVVGGTFTTGAFLTLAWPTTPTSYKCQVNQDGGATNFGIGHGVASPTGITISSSNTIAGATVSVDYSCKP